MWVCVCKNFFIAIKKDAWIDFLKSKYLRKWIKKIKIFAEIDF
jgi:hypothetical protein